MAGMTFSGSVPAATLTTKASVVPAGSGVIAS
jgi:hypothetical protein